MSIPYLPFYLGLKPQEELDEKAIILGDKGETTVSTSHPSKYEALDDQRLSYDPQPSSTDFGHETNPTRLGDLALGCSGDKGVNVDFGIFPKKAKHWDWLRCFMTRATLRKLIGADWRERGFCRAHGVSEHPLLSTLLCTGILGRRCSNSTLLDNLGKEYTDYVRGKVVDVPFVNSMRGLITTPHL